jgi:hypothetical protein
MCFGISCLILSFTWCVAQFINSIRQSSDGLQIASLLIQTTFDDPVRHFGFQILEHNVREKWYSLPVDQQAYFKQFSLDILRQVFV